jgi:hypothetical protein
MPQVYSHHLSPKALLLAFTETTLIGLSLLAGVKLRFLDDWAAFEVYTLLPDFAVQAVVVVLTFQLCFYYNDLYDLTRTRSQNELLLRIGEALGAGCLLTPPWPRSPAASGWKGCGQAGFSPARASGAPGRSGR